jgi:hypothetical protein
VIDGIRFAHQADERVHAGEHHQCKEECGEVGTVPDARDAREAGNQRDDQEHVNALERAEVMSVRGIEDEFRLRPECRPEEGGVVERRPRCFNGPTV